MHLVPGEFMLIFSRESTASSRLLVCTMLTLEKIDPICHMWHITKKAKDSVSIRELHEKTGDLVRKAGESRTPLPVTDRGKVVAVLVRPDAIPLVKRPKQVLLPEYVRLILNGPKSGDVLEDLEAVRGDR